jgi:DNA-binding transcriptional regulator YdaS (Cro superfamily)
MNLPLKNWMAQATTAQQERLAKLAGTTRGTLYQYSSGVRKASSERAIALEEASKRFPKLPKLLRTDLSATCASCKFAKTCLSAK